MKPQFTPGQSVSVTVSGNITKYGSVQRLTENTVYVKHFNGSVVGYKPELVTATVIAEQQQRPYGVGLSNEISAIQSIMEKTLTPAEKKKREEVAQAIERDNPDMPMDKKMAIATATAKKVAEAYSGKNPDHIKTVTSAGAGNVVCTTNAGAKHTVSAKDTGGKMPKPGEHIGKYVKEAVEQTHPKTDKEKALAKLAPPHDKITHADVLTGRGVKKEEAGENLPGQATHLTNKDLRQPGSEYGIISRGTTLRHLGGNKYEVRAGRARGKHMNIDSEHVQKLAMEGTADQLDELSGATLGSFMQKRNKQNAAKVAHSRELDNDPEVQKLHAKIAHYSRNYEPQHQPKIDAAYKAIWDRHAEIDPKFPKSIFTKTRGIEKAAKRLRKNQKLTEEDLSALTLDELDALIEHAEQLDELSGATLGSFIQKRHADNMARRAHAKELDNDPEVQKLNAKIAHQDGGDRGEIAAARKRIRERKKELDPQFPKSTTTKRHGIEKALTRILQGRVTEDTLSALTLEELDALIEHADQLDELSVGTLQSYRDKTDKRMKDLAKKMDAAWLAGKHDKDASAEHERIMRNNIRAGGKIIRKSFEEEAALDEARVGSNFMARAGQRAIANMRRAAAERDQGTHPSSEREKDLAAAAHPKDKITHKDVLVKRGAIKEGVEITPTEFHAVCTGKMTADDLAKKKNVHVGTLKGELNLHADHWSQGEDHYNSVFREEKIPTDWMGVPTKLPKGAKPIKPPAGYHDYIKHGVKYGFQDDPNHPLRKKPKSDKSMVSESDEIELTEEDIADIDAFLQSEQAELEGIELDEARLMVSRHRNFDFGDGPQAHEITKDHGTASDGSRVYSVKQPNGFHGVLAVKDGAVVGSTHKNHTQAEAHKIGAHYAKHGTVGIGVGSVWSLGSGIHGKVVKESLDESMISYSDFTSKLAAHKKAGNKIKDDKYGDKKASYIVIDQDGVGKKITHTAAGTTQQHLGQVEKVGDDSQATEKRGRGRPAGSKSGARN